MLILEVKKDKKHLFKVIFQNGEEILIDKTVLEENSVYEGMDLSVEDISNLLESSDYYRARSRALWYLDRADHTEKALYQKLLRAGFPKKASAKVLARLVEIGAVDDRRYAERYAERCVEANISKREALHKMLEKGVPINLAKEVLNDIETDELSQIKALLEGKYAYKLSRDGGVQKVYASLIRKGFSFSAVKEALKVYSEELENSEEYDV